MHAINKNFNKKKKNNNASNIEWWQSASNFFFEKYEDKHNWNYWRRKKITIDFIVNSRKSFKRAINDSRSFESICSCSVQKSLEACKGCFFVFELFWIITALSSCLIFISNFFFIIDFQCNIDDYDNDVNVIALQYFASFD